MTDKKLSLKLKKIHDTVLEEMSCSAHNIEHIMRVVDLCKKIAADEKNIDMETLLISAYMHDIARVKEDQDVSGKTDHSVLGAEMSADILINFGYSKEIIDKVKHCIISHRFRSGHKPKSIEAKILFDADKLDVIGAIGLARTYMLSGQYGQSLDFDSNNYSVEDNTDNNGRLKDISKHSPIFEFEYKNKKIPERLYTDKAKKIASERLAFMEQFFERLKDELKGNC